MSWAKYSQAETAQTKATQTETAHIETTQTETARPKRPQQKVLFRLEKGVLPKYSLWYEAYFCLWSKPHK